MVGKSKKSIFNDIKNRVWTLEEAYQVSVDHITNRDE